MNNINNNDDFEKKKSGFVEVLRLMETCNAANKAKDTASWTAMAKTFKELYDAFVAVGFTREEAIQLLVSLVGGLGGK